MGYKNHLKLTIRFTYNYRFSAFLNYMCVYLENENHYSFIFRHMLWVSFNGKC